MQIRCTSLMVIAAFGLLACDDSSSDGPRFIVPNPDGGALPDTGSTVLPAGCEPVEPTYAGFAAEFFADQCLSCHSSSRTGVQRAGAPAGVDFDSADEIAFHGPRIRARAIDDRSMPPGAPLSDCLSARLAAYLAGLPPEAACQPMCEGLECGEDGCGGSCGDCGAGQLCSPTHVCIDEACTPACEGIACGDDGCAGSCGECGPGLACTGGQCVCAPQCDGRSCGDDGCGGSCGSCADGTVCGLDGSCLCIPSCDALVCGDDGCGGTCGTCAPGETCVNGDSCECVPDCAGKKCGDDGCGGECPDMCKGALSCRSRTHSCEPGACVPDCAGRECGSDNCGGFCGSLAGACPGGQACNDSGQCACQPDCAGKACGDDGCGGSCGACAGGLSCQEGQCGCSGDCSGRECGGDGCGGSCGTCADGLSCSAGQCMAQCVPSCSGKSCGDDGCGGSCGACGAGQACEEGACSSAPVTFDQVFAIFQAKGCADNGCHSGARPAENLDLATAAAAQAELIDVAASQCSERKLVVRGAPAQSYLMNKLTGSGMCSGSRMPKGASALTSAQLDVVRTWIAGL